MHTSYSVFHVKRLLGREFYDPEVQSDIKHFPFKVINRAGKPYISVEYRGRDKEFVSALSSVAPSAFSLP